MQINKCHKKCQNTFKAMPLSRTPDQYVLEPKPFPRSPEKQVKKNISGDPFFKSSLT